MVAAGLAGVARAHIHGVAASHCRLRAVGPVPAGVPPLDDAGRPSGRDN